MFEDRNYVIFNVSEIDVIDFSEVLETRSESLRKSIDETLTFVKWVGETVPTCVENLTTKTQYYTHEEILEILRTEIWSEDSEIEI